MTVVLTEQVTGSVKTSGNRFPGILATCMRVLFKSLLLFYTNMDNSAKTQLSCSSYSTTWWHSTSPTCKITPDWSVACKSRGKSVTDFKSRHCTAFSQYIALCTKHSVQQPNCLKSLSLFDQNPIRLQCKLIAPVMTKGSYLKRMTLKSIRIHSVYVGWTTMQ